MDFGKQLSNVEAAAEAAKTKMIPVVSAMIGDGKKILDPLTESATVYRDHLRKAENAMKRTALKLQRDMKFLDEIGAKVDTAGLSVDICQKLTSIASDLVPQDLFAKVTEGMPASFGSLQNLVSEIESLEGGMGSALQGALASVGGSLGGGMEDMLGGLASMGSKTIQDMATGALSGVVPKMEALSAMTPESMVQTALGQVDTSNRSQVGALLAKTGLATEFLAHA